MTSTISPAESFMRRASLILSGISVLLTVASSVSNAGDAAHATEAVSWVSVRLLDEQEKPVVGAKAVWSPSFRQDNEKGGRWRLEGGVQSNADGIVKLKKRPRDNFIYARHDDRHLVGVKRIPDQKSQKEFVIKMYPECHVSIRLISSALAARHRTLEWPAVRVDSPSGYEGPFSMGADSRLHAFLFPGLFNAVCSGRDTYDESRLFAVARGQKELDLGRQDLHVKQLVLLQGEPAPEIDDILEWKNGPPRTLADLRGKVVLLEFWGWWCGPCVRRGLPQMFKLQDEFRAKDLVIVGVHTPALENDDVDTVQKLDTKLAKIRADVWKGRDITFPVALTRPQSGRYYAGGEAFTASKMCFKYGIFAWPTTVLIDKQGKVVGEFEPSNDKDRAVLKRLLEAQ